MINTSSHFIELHNPGINTQVQDIGRKGYLFAGVAPAGFIEPMAAFTANRLCGNPAGMALLEIPMGNISFTIRANNTIAVTGAEVQVKVNGALKNTWQSLAVQNGDDVVISPARKGTWVYLAIRGGFNVKPVLGSCATNQRERLGGFDGVGSNLKKGQYIPCFDSDQTIALKAGNIVKHYLPENDLVLRLLPGAQYSKLSKIQRRVLFNTRFTLSNDFNRMGYRLDTESKVLTRLPKITPDAIAYGAVQIPPSGKPIVLLNDRQSLGGYCKPGSVVSPDCHRLIQSAPGTNVRFELIRPSVAQSLVSNYWQEIQKVSLHPLQTKHTVWNE